MVITPPQVHIRVAVLLRAGWLAMSTVGAPPGIQGEAVAGTQGAGVGVKTPKAAVVAADVAAGR